jgi:hypothetical protein
MRLLQAAILLVFATIIVSCSGSDDDGASSPAVVPSPTAAISEAEQFCAGAELLEPSATVASPDLIETSGLAVSRTQDVVWAHNDSGDTARVFAIGPEGEALATYTLNGAEATDWEDMALGPGPEESVEYLYLGDIGDNASIRPSIAVYRAPEPNVDPASSNLSIEADAFTLQYPDGAHDAETLLVDPANGDIYVVTKNIAGGPSGIYRAAAPQAADAPITLEELAEIDFAALAPTKVIPPESGPLPLGLPKVPTGGDISPDGRVIAVRTYGTTWMWARAEGQSVADAFAGEPCEAPSEVQPQGEAIAFTADGRGYVTASEGANVPLHRFALK